LAIRALPDRALLRTRREGEREVLGLLTFNREGNRVVLAIDAQVTLDPATAAALSRRLAQTSERCEGVFTNWEPRPRVSRTPGLEDVSATMVGDTLQLELTLDASRSGAVLWRLTSEPGLFLELDWSYEGVPRIRNVGPLTLPLSLARRARHDLTIADGRLTNAGRRTASVAYVQAGSGQFAKSKRADAMALRPGESAPLSDFDLPPGADPTAVIVPPEAVTVKVGPDPFEDFLRDPDLLETVTVRNLLPAHDAVRQTDLRFVEVRVVQVVDAGGEAVESSAGPFRLAPRGADSAEVGVPFIRPGTKPRKYRVEGTAYYQGNDSRDVLKPTTTDGRSFDITEAVLPVR
jgi:hypothetical protein